MNKIYKKEKIYPKSVLIVEDTPHSFRSQIAEVKRHYIAENVVLPETAVKRLKEKKFDFIVLDATLPTKILENKDGYRSGYSFYDEYVSQLAPNAKIIFWDRRTEKFFDKEKYGDESKFLFVHKIKDRYHLRNAIDSFGKDENKEKTLTKDNSSDVSMEENTIIIDGEKIILK